MRSTAWCPSHTPILGLKQTMGIPDPLDPLEYDFPGEFPWISSEIQEESCPAYLPVTKPGNDK